MTYSASIRAPKGLMAIMSAKNDGYAECQWRLPLRDAAADPVVSDRAGRRRYRTTTRSATAAASTPSRPSCRAAAKEFADMEKMVEAAESLYGAYRWEQYDVLILPPSFPYGGMENPRLTFLRRRCSPATRAWCR